MERGEEERRKEEEDGGGGEGINTLGDWGAFPFGSSLFFSKKSANGHNSIDSSPGDISRIDLDTPCYQGVSFVDAYREQ